MFLMIRVSAAVAGLLAAVAIGTTGAASAADHTDCSDAAVQNCRGWMHD